MTFLGLQSICYFYLLSLCWYLYNCMIYKKRTCIQFVIKRHILETLKFLWVSDLLGILISYFSHIEWIFSTIFPSTSSGFKILSLRFHSFSFLQPYFISKLVFNLRFSKLTIFSFNSYRRELFISWLLIDIWQIITYIE